MCLDARGVDSDHVSGDRADCVEERGHQVQEKRTVPGCPGERQSTHVRTRSLSSIGLDSETSYT